VTKGGTRHQANIKKGGGLAMGHELQIAETGKNGMGGFGYKEKINLRREGKIGREVGGKEGVETKRCYDRKYRWGEL